MRELEHAIHRAVVLARGTQHAGDIVLEAHHFALSDEPVPPAKPVSVPLSGQNLREATEAFQRTLISRALEESGGKWAACARALEMDVANLHRLAKRLGLKD